ncbi:hypothetical protein P3L10_000618 [Capsicum annuum]|uniref:uncharacterized protein LOC124897202 n=1 Tax=Capsicum annuum TaxID=4072 RepID=UPI001FB102DB|nr:uncharacterized protein LOC124897202 [Capsicum annuum]
MAYLIPEASKSSKLPVKNFIKNGKWNTDKLKTILSNHIAEHINTIGIGNSNLKDQVFWDLTNYGKYSNKTAWNLVRFRNTKQPLINKVWHNSIPFKMSFLAWRIWKRKVPFEDVILKFGKHLDSKCYCCTVARDQTIDHVFSQGTITSKVWNLFVSPLGIKHSHLSVRHVINFWYGNQKKFRIYKLENLVGRSLQMAIHNTFQKYNLILPWKDICQDMYKLNPVIKTQVVCWQKPDTGSTKLNTDGSFNNNNGKAGLGGALRYDNGDLIMAFSIKAHCNNHNIAEAKAAWYGINWCLQNGYNNFTIESDSTVITDMLKNKKASNFRLNKIIQDTTELLRQATVKHTYC